jgi:hypothetical protein
MISESKCGIYFVHGLSIRGTPAGGLLMKLMWLKGAPEGLAVVS